MESDLASQYETIGARMVRYLKEFPPGDNYVMQVREFIRRYSEAPLFIIGNPDSTEQEHSNRHEETAGDFRLPFPTMLLDFPSGLYKEFKGKDASSTKCIIYLNTLAEDTYMVEILRVNEATREAMDTLMSPAQRSYLMAYPQLRDSVENPGRTVGDSGCYILKMHPGSNQCSFTYSKDFVYDCKAACKRIPGIIAYSPFADCEPAQPCQWKTPMCKILEDSGRSLAGTLYDIIAYINRPDRFVVKITPDMTEHEKKLKGKGKKTTFNKKPFHVVLDHAEIRQVIAESHGGHHASPLPHQRRGHWRDLRAQRYRKQRSVWVRPSDVNKGLTIRLKKAVYEVIT